MVGGLAGASKLRWRILSACSAEVATAT
jgi:hypothetical protein